MLKVKHTDVCQRGLGWGGGTHDPGCRERHGIFLVILAILCVCA